MTDPDHLHDTHAQTLAAIRHRDTDLDRLSGHVTAFAVMMTGRHGDRLDGWITTVETY
jgi:hypothetical protein